MTDIQIKSWDAVDFSSIDVPIITIYKMPVDFPNQYVARLFSLNKPINIIMLADSYVDLVREKPWSMTIIPRSPEDHPSVVEIWL